jgi:hypothetical protein
MAYVDDLTPPRQRRKPLIVGAPTPEVTESFNAPSPVDPSGQPNPGYTGNTGIRPPRIPPVVTPPPVTPPPVPPMGPDASGGQAQPRNTPPPPQAPQAINYQQALDALYRKYFYRAPNPDELSAHLNGLTKGYGTLAGIEAELDRESKRLQLQPPAQTPAQTPTAPAQERGQAPVGVDAGKWASGHTSPKYAFMEVSQKYDQRTPDGRAQTLAELQSRYPQWFSGWTIDGDKLRHVSGSLHADFDGFNEFDAWVGSQAGQWQPAWQPTQRGGQAFVEPGVSAPSTPSAPVASPAPSGVPVPSGTANAAGGGSSAVPNQSGLPLGPLSGELGGSEGVDFGITGPFGYDDPSTQQLEQFLRMLIDEKTDPIDDPARNDYANVLKQRFESLIAPGAGTNTAASDYDQQLRDAITRLGDRSTIAPNAAATDLDRQLQAAIAELTANPAMSPNDRSRMENRAIEPLERERQIEIQNAIERMAAKGLGRGSGAYEEVIREINARYNQQRDAIRRDLSIYEQEQVDDRRGEAITYGTQRMSAAEREIERQRQIEDARRQEAVTYGGERRDLYTAELDRERGRYGEALTMAEALSNLSGQQRGERDARMREALTYVSLFPEMDERRLRLAMETLGMSNSMANAPSIFNTLSSLSAQANQAAAQGRQANAEFWGQMGQWMADAWGSGS